MESRHLFGLSAVLLVAIFLSGCAMEPTKISEHLPPPPNATIGPEMQLLKIPTSTDDIASAVLDKLGKAHVIIAAERLKEVSYVVIGANGVLSSQVMLTHVTPNSIDLAFDREGRLHALIDDEHLMLKDGHWIGQLRTPWKEAGVHPVWGEPQFVKGAPDLTWAFYLGGSDLNLGRRFGVVGGANLAFPVMTKVIKLVVVPEEAPYKHWNAVGMEDNSDIQPHAKVMADGKMNIYVAYVPTADFKSYEYYYASFCANCDCPKPVPEPRTKPKSEAQEAYNHYNTERKYNLAPKLPNGTSACAIEGVPLGKMAADAMKYYRSIRNKDVAINWGDLPGMSVDPQTGDILLVTRVGTALDRNGTWGGFSQQPITNVQFFLAPAG
jgi:hypothetical protein